MGFGFPKEEQGLGRVRPAQAPHAACTRRMRYNWVRVRLAAIDVAELSELGRRRLGVAVPKSMATAFAGVAHQSRKAGSSTPLIEPSRARAPRLGPGGEAFSQTF